MAAQAMSLNDYLAILRRRRARLVVPTLLLFALAATVAFVWPPSYRSTATILIEQQDIPTDLVRSTISSYADQRLQLISQRVMVSSNLLGIVERHNLYAAVRKRATVEELLERMREDIDMEVINAEVIDPRSGRATEATIAFTLSYSSESPALAQKVANELVSLYLNENLESRAQQVAHAAEFLERESAKLSSQIAGYESKLATFKKENVGQLPELVELNLQLMDRAERELMEARRHIRTLEERRIYLQSELAQINPYSAILASTGERILGSADRLRALQAEYVSASAVYGSEHPDVVKMRREMEGLQRDAATGNDPAVLFAALEVLRADLAAAREKYSARHPDVRKLERSVAALQEKVDGLRPVSQHEPSRVRKPDNPAYIQLEAELDAAKTELASFHKQARELQAKLTDYEKRLAETPQVEREYRELTRDYESALRRYQEIKAKQSEAQMAEALEKGRQGERFSLIEPPLLPESPESPNRIAILLLGFMVSVSGGLGAVALKEGTEDVVCGAKAVAAITGAAPLAAIPRFSNAAQLARRRRLWLGLAGAGLLALLGILAAIHFHWRPLDILWFVALRRLGL